MKILWVLCLFFSLPLLANEGSQSCQSGGVWLQVLGSGGPEMTDKRASSSYLIWKDAKAVALVDTGSGSLFQFEQTGADFADVRGIFYSHFHVDHSADFAGFIKAAFFTDRGRDLYVFGPSGNSFMPSTDNFVMGLLGDGKGVFEYLSAFTDKNTPSAFKIKASVIDVGNMHIQAVYQDDLLKVSSIPVHHGNIPSLAWRIEIAGKVLVFSGDNSGQYQTLAVLAKDADLLVAHHAVPEGATGVGRFLHMPPSVIGRIAKAAEVKQLVLSHRMQRSLGKEQESSKIIRKSYQQALVFANDLDCFKP